MLRVHLFLLVAGIFVSSQSFAACNTVMGGCAKEDTVNVSPHMRGDYVAKTKAVKPAVAATKATNKGKTNTNYASAAQKNTQ